MYFSICKEPQSRLQHVELSLVLRVSYSSCRTGAQQEIVFVALKNSIWVKCIFLTYSLGIIIACCLGVCLSPQATV